MIFFYSKPVNPLSLISTIVDPTGGRHPRSRVNPLSLISTIVDQWSL